jgi:anthranilate synthase component II
MELKILVFDNYDSFTYNLVHLVEKILHQKVDIYRNDQIPLEKVNAYDKIILSPGPGIPEEAGMLLPLIKEYASTKSILGVCLGHQAIGEAFGGKLVNLSTVYHGVATPVRIVSRQLSEAKGEWSMVSGQGSRVNENTDSPFTIHHSPGDLFEGIADEIEVGRYHSWIVSDEDLPQELQVTVRDENNYIMGLRHRTHDVQGVQFHPESVLTPVGEQIMRNWLKS